MSDAHVITKEPVLTVARERKAAAPLDSDMLVEFARIGFHPFILVRHGQPGAEGRAFVACKTQNEAPEFVNEVGVLPHFAQSRLVRGIERALQLETYDAADLLFQWTKGAPDELNESVHIGLPAGSGLPYYAGYPVFAIAATTPGSREARVQALSEVFEAYRSTQGNDALRFALIEALGFALSRAHGALGHYANAAQFVDAALDFHPYSIYLKAAKHALGLKIEGKQVPDRLAKFVGEDSGYLKQFVCPEPFKRFDIGPAGDVLVCCGHWLPTSIGNFLQSPIDEVLNSARAQKLRRSMTDGSYKYCNHLECGTMIQGTLPRREEVQDPQILHAIEREDFHVDGVEQVLFALDRTCNLSCPSCRTERITEKVSASEHKARAVEEKLLPLLPTLRVLNINPAGELFASKPSRKILELINDDLAPDLVLDIISNGTLFSEEEWNKFPGIHNKIRSVRISIDAATKETFEKLRRLGKYEPFLENMRFLRDLRASGTIPQLKFSCTYQRDNFHEMREFVAFCASMNADFAIFERLQNLGAYSEEEYRERAVHYPSHPLYGEFLDVVRDPLFRSTLVWHDFDYPGVEKMSRDEARGRLVEALKGSARVGSGEGEASRDEQVVTAPVAIPVEASANEPVPEAPAAAESRIEREKFLYIAALPKSASSLAWLVVSALQESNGRANPSRRKGDTGSPFLPLGARVLEAFPEGGTYKSHAPLNFDTAHFLEVAECKYLVVLRHPADFIAALYCHMLGIERARTDTRQDGMRAWTYALTPMRRSMFGAAIPVDDAISQLIRDGALFGALDWMAQWLTCRDEGRSLVVTYEDLVQRLEQTVARLSFFVRGEEPSRDLLDYLRHVAASGLEEAGHKDAAKYPRGWTGKVGVWTDYFSEQNVRLYNKVVSDFLNCHPFGKSLGSVYPNLKLRVPRQAGSSKGGGNPATEGA